MKTRLFFLLLVVSAITLFSGLQTATAQNNIMASVSVGVNVPAGDYAKTDFSDSTSGFAKTGVNLNLFFAYKFNKFIGLGAMVTGGVNSIDQQKIRDEIVTDFRNLFPDANLSVTTKQWGLGGILGGVILSLPMNKRLAIDVRVMVGFFYAYSPEIRIDINPQSTDPEYIIMEKDKAPAFAYDFGGSFRYNLGGKKYFLLNFDYLSSTPEFKNATTYYSFDTDDVSTFKQEITCLNITIGVGYFIN